MRLSGLKIVRNEAAGARAGRAQVHPHRHQALLRAVVQIVFDTPSLNLGYFHDAALRGA